MDQPLRFCLWNVDPQPTTWRLCWTMVKTLTNDNVDRESWGLDSWILWFQVCNSPNLKCRILWRNTRPFPAVNVSKVLLVPTISCPAREKTCTRGCITVRCSWRCHWQLAIPGVPKTLESSRLATNDRIATCCSMTTFLDSFWFMYGTSGYCCWDQCFPFWERRALWW